METVSVVRPEKALFHKLSQVSAGKPNSETQVKSDMHETDEMPKYSFFKKCSLKITLLR